LASGRWPVRLSAAADHDFQSILQWTRQTFGVAQARAYQEVLIVALAELASGPDVPGSIGRDEIRPGLRSLHVARGRRRGRHFVLYRTAQPKVIEVVRILHDAMDLARHIPAEES
jgi:toxin ParE1/3/4